MSTNYGNFNEAKKQNFVDREQVFFKVFGCGSEVKLLTTVLPAGMPYADRIAVFNNMDKHIKSVGGKVLKDGFWNCSPRPSDPPDDVPDFSASDGLPF